MTDEPEVLTRESLFNLAVEHDTGQGLKPKEEVLDDPEPTNEKPAKESDVKEAIKPKEDDSESDSKDTEAKGTQKPEEKVKSRREQNEERKGKTWQEINAEKEVLKAEKEALARDREEVNRRAEAIQRAKAASEPIRDDHGVTAKEYRDAAKDFRAKGSNAEADACEQLAGNLDRKQKQLQEEGAKAQFAEAWKRTYEAVSTSDPDINKPDSPLQKETAKILTENRFLLSQEDGLKHAVKLAKANLLLQEFEGTKAELSKLKEDQAKLQKKLSIDGGPPTGTPGDEAPEKAPTRKEERKRLERLALEHDRERGFADD